MDNIPKTFQTALNDCVTGNTFTVTDIQFESEDYNRGYIDGMNQARKEAQCLMQQK